LNRGIYLKKKYEGNKGNNISGNSGGREMEGNPSNPVAPRFLKKLFPLFPSGFGIINPTIQRTN
jgi:hypothetical protein